MKVNKSHATAYAMVAMFTAYLKEYHTEDFYRSSLNAIKELGEIPAFACEMPFFGIELKGPDMMLSQNPFTVEDDGNIRYGLKYVKSFSEQNVTRASSIQAFLEANPDVSLKVVEKYARLGMFEEGWTLRNDHKYTPYNRHAHLKWIAENGKAFKTYQACCKKTEELDACVEAAEKEFQETKSAEADKKIGRLENQKKNWMQKRKTAAEVLSTKRAEYIAEGRRMQENMAEVLENREWETEMLSMPFNLAKSRRILQGALNRKTFDDLAKSKDELGTDRILVPAIVLSTSDAKKTKTSKSTYYEVLLMDREGHMLKRRFTERPTVLEGEFLLTIEDCKYFSCDARARFVKTKKPEFSYHQTQTSQLEGEKKASALAAGAKFERVPVTGNRSFTSLVLEEEGMER